MCDDGALGSRRHRGQAAEQLLAATAAGRPASLQVAAVVDTLHRIAEAEGPGSQGRKLELMATLPGEPLYRALGFSQLERAVVPLPDGALLPVVHMARPLSAPLLPATGSASGRAGA